MAHQKSVTPHSRFISLCGRVLSFRCAFEDIEPEIEEMAALLCRNGEMSEVVSHLREMAEKYEAMELKNEENIRDLKKLYLLVGGILQTYGCPAESIEWFLKVVAIDERDPYPYQCMARSYLSAGDIDKAVRSLEQEIALAPGNYFSYLTLAQLYEKQNEPKKVEECLQKLLSRDPQNVYALHELIKHHRARHPDVDIAFLQRRLLSISRPLSKKELLIWAYYMIEQKREGEVYRQALRINKSPDAAYWRLILWQCAAVTGAEDVRREAARSFSIELSRNRRNLKTWVEEFKAVFGSKAARLLKEDLKHVGECSGAPSTA